MIWSLAFALMMVLAPLAAHAGVACSDVAYGSEKYHDKMEELARSARLPDNYYNRYHEDVVRNICSGNTGEIKNLIDSGYVTAGEVESIKKALGKSEPAPDGAGKDARSEAGQNYGLSRRKFSDMGLCSACADNTAQYYTKKPDSPCAKLAQQALAGNPQALETLKSFPSYCQWQYPEASEALSYAVEELGNGKAYFFTADQYTRYDIGAGRPDPGYPKPIDQANWPGIPWTGGIDAIANWGNGKAYFFKGSEYIRYDLQQGRADPGYPKPIDQANWPGMPWTGGIDAIANWGNGKVYFFKGSEYIRYDIATDRTDPGYPKPINQANWPGIPWTGGIDALANWGNGKAYFIKAGQYISYDIRADKADPGYPKPLSAKNMPGNRPGDGHK